MIKPVHWYIQPQALNPPSFCVTHEADADAAEWHEKQHGHKVTPLYSKEQMAEIMRLLLIAHEKYCFHTCSVEEVILRDPAPPHAEKNLGIIHEALCQDMQAALLEE